MNKLIESAFKKRKKRIHNFPPKKQLFISNTISRFDIDQKN